MSEQTIDKVIAKGICVGCGACAAVAPTDFQLEFTEQGQFAAHALRPAAERSRDISPLCPMSGEGPDETALAARLWPDLPSHPEIGKHGKTGVAWVEEGEFRARGSSGGLLTWLAATLLERGMVAEVIQVAPTQAGSDKLFAYSVSTTADQVRRAAKSRYYPIQAQDVISHMRQSGKATLFVGLPCFVKMIRVLAETDPAIAANLRYASGLVCGHLKSAAFAEMLAWQVGVAPKEIATVDFRVKVEGQSAARYGFSAQSTVPGAPEARALMAGLVGRDWGQGMMRYKACDYCDDVLAECADIAVGDAWLAPWTEEWQGTNVFVARHPDIVALLNEAQADKRLFIEDLTASRVADSQRGGLSHRREGLAWRLLKAQKAGIWAPRKRVTPARALTPKRERIYDLREQIRDESHLAFVAARQTGQFELFVQKMAAPLALYAQANRQPGWLHRKLSATKRAIKALLGRPRP
jgi:coenzyme F420 hydrogenase subunit beta